MDTGFFCKFIKPDSAIAEFVESIGMFHNPSDAVKEVIIMPDGRVDLFFLRSAPGPFQVTLIGLETAPEQRNIPPQTLAYVISFKPIAVEYILHTSIADIVNSARDLPADFWNFDADDFSDLEAFYKKASQKIREHLPAEIDDRKSKLFDLIYSSNGEISVKEISDKVFWSSRQINRYFNQQMGLSLKAFCTILRFRASLEHIAHGRLFPELNFTDQTHFIKEIKKFSGVCRKSWHKMLMTDLYYYRS